MKKYGSSSSEIYNSDSESSLSNYREWDEKPTAESNYMLLRWHAINPELHLTLKVKTKMVR